MGGTWRGFVGLGGFFHIWVGATTLIPLAVIALVVWHAWWPSLLLVAYYAFRFVVPRQPWPAVHEALSASLHTPGGRYFTRQVTVIDGEPVRPDSSTLLAFHPHGILCCGWSVNGCMGRELGASAKISWLGTGALFWLPLISDVLRYFRGASADGPSMRRLMERGENVALLPGGFQEATLFARNRHRVYINQRKGFIKYALRHGYTLRPVYTFGEERTYYTINACERQRMAINTYKIPSALFFGKYGPVLPDDNAELVTVVGPPMKLPRVAEPSNALVAEWHAKYVAALVALFNKHKTEHAAQGARAQLEVL